jgi:hypothetical protein
MLMAFSRTALCAVLAGALGACAAGAVVPAGPPSDTPVAPGEPRAVLRAVVDLEPTSGCEQRFDLAMYRDRSIELIEWDRQRGLCTNRTVAIRYLSRRTDAGRVAQAARQHAVRLTIHAQGNHP